MEDHDCTYGFLLRDIPAQLFSAQIPHQDCWDYCTNYVLNGASKCKARKLLANGGQIFCGYKGGRYHGMKAPYSSRCHVFVFPANATLYNHYDYEIIGPDPPQATSPVLTSFGVERNQQAPIRTST